MEESLAVVHAPVGMISDHDVSKHPGRCRSGLREERIVENALEDLGGDRMRLAAVGTRAPSGMLSRIMRGIDFGRHSEDYAAHRPGFPPSFYRRLDAIIRLRGSRSLDLATGPGTIALELGARGGSVVGIDTSPQQIATAQRAAEKRRLKESVQFRIASAESTGLDDGSFDLATAGHCWHWFDHRAVMAEMQRVLRPGGVLAIADYSYLAEHSPVARDTEGLILRFNPSWTMAGSTGVYPERIEEAIHGGFRFIEAFCYHHVEEFSHARWRGRMRTCNGVGSGSLSPSEVLRFDEALSLLLSEKHPEPMMIHHRVWCVVAGKPS